MITNYTTYIKENKNDIENIIYSIIEDINNSIIYEYQFNIITLPSVNDKDKHNFKFKILNSLIDDGFCYIELNINNIFIRRIDYNLNYFSDYHLLYFDDINLYNKLKDCIIKSYIIGLYSYNVESNSFLDLLLTNKFILSNEDLNIYSIINYFLNRLKPNILINFLKTNCLTDEIYNKYKYLIDAKNFDLI